MSLEALDTIGDLLFGRSLRLFVAYWILSQGGREFQQMALINACGKDGANARKPLGELVDLGMVASLQDPRSRARRYKMVANPLWSAVRIAVEAAGENPDSEPRRTFSLPVVERLKSTRTRRSR